MQKDSVTNRDTVPNPMGHPALSSVGQATRKSALTGYVGAYCPLKIPCLNIEPLKNAARLRFAGEWRLLGACASELIQCARDVALFALAALF